MNLVDKITKSQIRTDIPEFRVGDTLKVDVKIQEKDAKGTLKTRIQAYEGIVTSIQGSGISKNFIVRKISGGVGVERTFPMNTPIIDKITVLRKGKVRRAKLRYLRTLKKDAKIKERN